jgi:uncharacterized delta-60 repeat protein
MGWARAVVVGVVAVGAVVVAAAGASADAGEPSPAYGVDGRSIDTAGFDPQNVVMRPDGSTIVLGSDGDRGLALRRYTPTGAHDQSWGDGGEVVISYADIDNDVFPAGLALDGNKPVVVYTRSEAVAVGENAWLAVRRFTARGRPDPTFAGGGELIANPDQEELNYAADVSVARNGTITVLGLRAVEAEAIVMRISPTGQLDTTFSRDGVVRLRWGAASLPIALAVTPTGQTVVVGIRRNDPSSTLSVVRLTASGRLDRSFGGDGRVSLRYLGNVVTEPTDVIVHGRSTVVVGYSTDDPLEFGGVALVARLRANGTLDATFGDAGVAAFRAQGRRTAMRAIVRTEDRRYVLAGSAGPPERVAVVRLGADGVLDTSFGEGGVVVGRYRPRVTSVGSDLALTPDQRAVVVVGPAVVKNAVRIGSMSLMLR